MQLTLALITGFALVATTVAVPEPNAASFVTWECNNCGQNPSDCTRHEHQNVRSETCFTLEPNQQSITVNYSVRPSCTGTSLVLTEES